ncbi:hypothetical protein OHS33_34970 [Streptomyces sp. NBC_00536]|uniref:hypothetical protein n=1 Tax=Streptomyces sp. NBC_00536 TaxID=2975769 RepID=UPI002E8125E2|nr:hypothetical protein [Streptomyces sp. NBC_00536]WUC83118.1 hypothetical protein OHS33_34970 [Streptomyces sp. NBC_00536]
MTIAYGLHADSRTLYPALSRARGESHLHLSLDELEDHPTRTALGPVRSDAERLARAVAAYGRQLDADPEDRMVIDELALTAEEAAGPHTSWRQRPYGNLPTHQLTARQA